MRDPFLQKSAPHRGEASVEHRKKSPVGGSAKRRGDLEIALRGCIEDDDVRNIVRNDLLDVREVGFLRFVEVMHHGTRRRDADRHRIDAKPFQRLGVKMADERFVTVIEMKNPIVDGRK